MRFLADHIFETIGVIAFAIGFTILMASSRQLQEQYLQAKEMIQENKIAYVEDSTEEKTDTISREDLISTLMTGISYDVSIDGTTLTAASYNARFFDYSNLADSYTKGYTYDKNGTIQRIQYTRR